MTVKKLNDAQMRSFLANGYITLQSGLPESFHEGIYGEFDKLIPDGYSEIPGKQKLNNPGNNILPMLPQLMELFEDDVIKGGLASMLGDDYILEPHRALHNSMPNDGPQPMHKDSYFGYKRHVRSHRPWTLLLMYYPQETPAERGPPVSSPAASTRCAILASVPPIRCRWPGRRAPSPSSISTCGMPGPSTGPTTSGSC